MGVDVVQGPASPRGGRGRDGQDPGPGGGCAGAALHPQWAGKRRAPRVGPAARLWWRVRFASALGPARPGGYGAGGRRPPASLRAAPWPGDRAACSWQMPEARRARSLPQRAGLETMLGRCLNESSKRSKLFERTQCRRISSDTRSRCPSRSGGAAKRSGRRTGTAGGPIESGRYSQSLRHGLAIVASFAPSVPGWGSPSWRACWG